MRTGVRRRCLRDVVGRAASHGTTLLVVVVLCGLLVGAVAVTADAADETGTHANLASGAVQAADGPTAEFAYDPEDPDPGEVVTFDASESSDPEGEIVEYHWEFGDGTFEETTDPEATHAYDDAGVYQVNLTVVSDNGENTTEQYLQVTPPDLIARCSVSSASVQPGEEVTIDADESERVTDVQFDYDGEYDEWVYEEPFEVTLVYEEPGDVRSPRTSVERRTAQRDGMRDDHRRGERRARSGLRVRSR